MAEPGDILHSDNDTSHKQPPWGAIIAVILFIGFGILAFFALHQRKTVKARAAVLSVLDQELETQKQALTDQREKVMDLTHRVEALRASIQTGETKKTKAAVAEFNQLAADQRAARDQFTKMADEYNKKVAQYRAIEE